MAGLILKGGTEVDRVTFIPAVNELIYTTDTKKLYVGDGITYGGNLVSGTTTGGSSVDFYSHYQGTASDFWYIEHNLGRNPTVTVMDTAIPKQQVIGDVNYISLNAVSIMFSGAMTGEAYLI
jgi:hypothetical protein